MSIGATKLVVEFAIKMTFEYERERLFPDTRFLEDWVGTVASKMTSAIEKEYPIGSPDIQRTIEICPIDIISS